MKHAFIILLFANLVFQGCKTRRTDPSNDLADSRLFTETESMAITSRIFRQMPFKANSSYVAMNIDVSAIEPLREELQTRYNLPLKSRGEAHITLITPSEMKILRQTLSVKEINETVKPTIQKSKLHPICIGRGDIEKNGRKLSTFFLVIKSEDLMNLRVELYKTFRAKGGSPDAFEVPKYYPHITIGFTDRDLHFEDGVIKDTDSCIITTAVLG